LNGGGVMVRPMLAGAVALWMLCIAPVGAQEVHFETLEMRGFWQAQTPEFIQIARRRQDMRRPHQQQSAQSEHPVGKRAEQDHHVRTKPRLRPDAHPQPWLTPDGIVVD
ncbi:MAG: hypothetical protein ACM3NO_11650, partial [Deltaproteobacteria bacterium]